MIPWLLIAGPISQKEQSFSAMLDERIALHPPIGEISRRLDDSLAAIARAQKVYEPQAYSIL